MAKQSIFTTNERKKRIQNIIPLLRKNWKILDCACGDGWLTDYLRSKGYDCIGVDLNTRKYVITDVRNLPFKDCEFDCVISIQTLEHVICEYELCRVLKKGGLLIIEVPSWDFPIKILTLLKLVQKGVFEHIRKFDLKYLPLTLVMEKRTGYGLCKFGVYIKW